MDSQGSKVKRTAETECGDAQADIETLKKLSVTD